MASLARDTSHVTAFAKILNDPNSPDYLPGGRIVAAYKGGSKDIEESASRVDKYADELRTTWKVEFYTGIDTLCKKVDAVLLTSVDGRVHLEQLKPILAAHKPVFIDKPLAATLEDAREIGPARQSRESPLVQRFQPALRRTGHHHEVFRRARRHHLGPWTHLRPTIRSNFPGTLSTPSNCCTR